MRWALLALAVAACQRETLPECVIEDGLPVFPGAEGYGTATAAGRGGATLVVTSLADDGPGTLREAVSTPGPRTIVFAVAGEIALRSHLEVHEPYLTIAGHSAPGDGVVVTGAGMVIFTHDVLVQHLRIRPGLGPVDPEVNDAVTILGPDENGTGAGAHHVVIDHGSFSWSEDELVSTGSSAHDLTLSYNLVAEALDEGRHPKGGHSAGLLIGFRANCISAHHNVLAHNGFRNPLLSDVGRVDYVNNLAYDYGVLAGELSPDAHPSEVNLVGNVWIPGPDSTTPLPALIVHGSHPLHYVAETYHLVGQAADAARIWVEDDLAPDTILAAGYGGEPVEPEQVAQSPFAAPAVTRWPADDLEAGLTPVVGATAPARDAVDERILAELAARSGGIVDQPSDVGGADIPPPADPRADQDGDGMPDDWEVAEGLDPTTPDETDDANGDGYTNLEEWLFSLL